MYKQFNSSLLLPPHINKLIFDSTTSVSFHQAVKISCIGHVRWWPEKKTDSPPRHEEQAKHTRLGLITMTCHDRSNNNRSNSHRAIFLQVFSTIYSTIFLLLIDPVSFLHIIFQGRQGKKVFLTFILFALCLEHIRAS